MKPDLLFWSQKSNKLTWARKFGSKTNIFG